MFRRPAQNVPLLLSYHINKRHKSLEYSQNHIYSILLNTEYKILHLLLGQIVPSSSLQLDSLAKHILERTFFFLTFFSLHHLEDILKGVVFGVENVTEDIG